MAQVVDTGGRRFELEDRRAARSLGPVLHAPFVVSDFESRSDSLLPADADVCCVCIAISVVSFHDRATWTRMVDQCRAQSDGH